MKKLIYFLIFLILISLVNAVVFIESQTSTVTETDNTMYIELESYIGNEATYILNNNSDGIDVDNYTITTRKGNVWFFRGDLI